MMHMCLVYYGIQQLMAFMVPRWDFLFDTLTGIDVIHYFISSIRSSDIVHPPVNLVHVFFPCLLCVYFIYSP